MGYYPHKISNIKVETSAFLSAVEFDDLSSLAFLFLLWREAVPQHVTNFADVHHFMISIDMMLPTKLST